MPLNVLVACESSGTVREAFRKLGHNAWSCDLLPADDASPYHYQQDCVDLISSGFYSPWTDDRYPKDWDIVIAHPPCTHLAVSGARHFAAKRADGRQQNGIDLFMAVINACQKFVSSWAVENPIGIMSRLYRKPDQIIQPWMFGHPETKATCLWLSGLRPLMATKDVRGEMLALPPAVRHRIHHAPPSRDRWKIRSKTYQGIADAMAAQWGGYVR